MSDVESIESDGAPAAIGPYSQAIRAGDWIFCSGQIPTDAETGEVVEGGIEAQTERVMRNLAAVLEAAGASFADVVRTTVYLSSMESFAAMNEVYGDHMGANRPARATVEVSALPRDVAVEIDAVAYRGAPNPRGPGPVA